MKDDILNLNSESSDDDASHGTDREGLECPIYWESFNLVENVPYILWCGHTLCKNCVLGLPWAALKYPNLPLQLPFFIACPWCNLLCPRMLYKGVLRFPKKNYFVLWMVESMNGDPKRSYIFGGNGDFYQATSVNGNYGAITQSQIRHHREVPMRPVINHNTSFVQRYFNLRNCLMFVVQLTAKFLLVLIFLLVTLYAIPASAAILALYVLITVLFVVPSLLVLYFAYPSLDWLIREIVT